MCVGEYFIDEQTLAPTREREKETENFPFTWITYAKQEKVFIGKDCPVKCAGSGGLGGWNG